MPEPRTDQAVEPDGTESGERTEVFPLATDEAVLLALVTEVFNEWWRSIRFGVVVEGAAWEVAAPGPPEKITVFDGYVTVDFGPWHFHLCIGEHTASGAELGRIRRCARAELYRSVSDAGAPVSWGFRMCNGEGTQLMTVMLPNPFLDDDQRFLPAPDWRRLACWDRLRAMFLGLDPEPFDRTGTGFQHG